MTGQMLEGWIYCYFNIFLNLSVRKCNVYWLSVYSGQNIVF
jgi:hypothetical protein